MGVQSTQALTRDDAISRLTHVITQEYIKCIEGKLQTLSNKELEEMTEKYLEDTFTNYIVVDKIDENTYGNW